MTSKIQNPLCVDLDGTLIATDSLWESLLVLLRQNFLLSFLLPLWLLKGRTYFKHQIAQRVTLEVATLPYRENILTFLRQEKMQGRILVLATAAHQSIAQAVAAHLNLFDVVLASDANTNMKSTTKRDTLQQRFGAYSYIGDSIADLPILRAAEQGYLVAPSRSLLKESQCPPDNVFSAPSFKWYTFLKALRPHQWSKNLLLFLPLILAHQLLEINQVLDALLAFVAFSLTASSGYVLNDLLDLAADRIHPTKQYRPFAAGLLSIPQGLALFVALVCLSFLISLSTLSSGFTAMLGLYLLLTMSYSLYFKQKLILDVLLLAGLYTHRILAGGIAITVEISSWLLAFSMFIFISLAFVKRYVELLQLSDKKTIKNRSYELGDIEMIGSMGPTSGFLAILVFSLYIDSDTVSQLYSSPFLLWLICPILLYWIIRIWFLAHRGQMLDDPVQFALTDKVSWFAGGCIILFMLLAKFF
jgi:4-hydroxybenzoate polyprenyltransferase/phosphoserine phosphatase